MPASEELGKFVAGLLETIKTESLEWQKKHNEDLLKLKKDKELADVELRHQIEELQARFEEHKVRIRMEEQHKTRQFSEFLQSIDETKTKILEHFPTMSKPIALMIHHHATELLKQAWNSPDTRDKLISQNKFTQLMLTITEELIEGNAQKSLPEKTLKFISMDQ